MMSFSVRLLEHDGVCVGLCGWQPESIPFIVRFVAVTSMARLPEGAYELLERLDEQAPIVRD